MEAEPPSLVLFGSALIVLSGISFVMVAGLLLLVLLLMCSALISGSEVAYLSLNARDLEDLRNEKSRRAHRVLRLRSSTGKLLMTLLILKNLMRVAIVIVSAALIDTLLPGEVLLSWAEAIQRLRVFASFTTSGIAHLIWFLMMLIVVTLLLVLFGEVAPKVYAKLNHLSIARLMSRPIQMMVFVLSPVSTVLAGWHGSIERRWNERINANTADASIKEDIDKAIDLAMPGDASSQMEAGILKSIIKFNDVPVKQIMRSRVDMVAIDTEMPFTKLKAIIHREGYSRMPVFRDNPDSIQGILYVKDLIGHMGRGDEFHWQDLIRTQVLYIPESKKINEVLKDFQREHKHMGIVVDEYGGTAGIVTLEDVMEEVIGEIRDEFDEAAEGEYRKIDEHTYLFDGKVLINDLCRIVGVDSSILDDVRGDADSLAGLILEMSGRMPARGEEFQTAGMAFTVISVTARRIEKIRVKLNEQN